MISGKHQPGTVRTDTQHVMTNAHYYWPGVPTIPDQTEPHTTPTFTSTSPFLIIVYDLT